MYIYVHRHTDYVYEYMHIINIFVFSFKSALNNSEIHHKHHTRHTAHLPGTQMRAIVKAIKVRCVKSVDLAVRCASDGDCWYFISSRHDEMQKMQNFEIRMKSTYVPHTKKVLCCY